jgi:tetraacyldisaccharide 4'-kinase
MSWRSLLLPLTPLYRLGLAMRERRLASGSEPVRRLRYPVISIGNLSAGGAGKTPLAIALARALTERGFRVDVLSRGYGRSGAAAARVRVDGTADQFGDEPLLIAREADVPVYVAAQRYDAGVLAESEIGSNTRAVHLLDDGFQHRQLHRDVDILLLSSEDLHDRLLPAGNLREPPGAMRRTTVIAIPAEEIEVELEIRRRGWQGPVWFLMRRMEMPSLSGPALGFCGIARPQQFFAGLESGGVRIAARQVFRDHHRYTARDLDRLVAQARASGAAALLTTEKDKMRLAGLNSALPILTAGLRTEIEEEPVALDWLVSQLTRGATR